MNDLLRKCLVSGLCLAMLSAAVGAAAPSDSDLTPGTPSEIVATYDNLATAILAVKKSEESLVRSILATTYGHAHASLERAQQAMKQGDSEAAQKAIEAVAAYVAQLGTEGDNAVAGIRKRLLEGGHHHHASGEAKGTYDPGFVVVTKAAKKEFLDASRAIAQIAQAPNEEALAREWKKVEATWGNLQQKQ